MANVFDVAAYVLRRGGSMTTMKLQKLVYFSQAYNLAWWDTPMFQEPIEAWTNGPVVRALWEQHAGQFTISEMAPGNPDALTAIEASVVDSVYDAMGGLTGKQLSDITHAQGPWLLHHNADARYHNEVIPQDVLKAYYRALTVQR